MSLEETKVRLLTASERADSLLAQVNDLYILEIQTEKKFLNDALSELHNSGEIDLVEILGSLDKSSRGHDFFTILRVFEDVLPSLNSSVEDVLNCLVHIDSGRAYGAFKRFCSVEVHRPRDSVEFILAQSERNAYAPFLSSSILAYDSERVTEAIQTTESLITNRNKMVRSQAYFILGRLDVGETQANVIWGLLSSSACNERENGCCASILRATLYFGATFPSYWSQIEQLLLTLIKVAHTEVLHEISDIVAFQRVDLPESVLCLLVKQLAHVSSEQNHTISNINYVLVKLLETDSSLIAVELLEAILVKGLEINELGYFSRELISNHQELLNNIITKWFLSGVPSLCHSVLKLLHDVTDKDIELKAEMALLDNGEKQIFVSHKAIGWLFTLPIAAASFIISIYEMASPITCKDLENDLYSPLLLSYPGELKRFLQSNLDEGIQEHLCARLLEKLRLYHSDIEKVSGLKELMAPRENVSAYWKESNKEMEVAYEEASKTSILSHIATTQSLLYGNSSIYYVHQVNGDKVRQEMQMHTFSHSTEIPRLNVLDPESLDYTLRSYRSGSMKK
ncbi:hypothetical protein [Shewanella frigidimarina]|uniref:hypothetical protein n=1 Tax=Shewanella frigidimarina TaxID=56812 RepID=UPI003D7A9E19